MSSPREPDERAPDHFLAAERKRIEAALRESEGRLAEAQSIARIGSWGWEPLTGEVWWSDALFRLFGVEPKTFRPSVETFLEMVHPDDRPLALSRIEAMLSAGSNEFADDLRIVRPDGELLWVHSRGRATRDDSGRVIRVEGTDQDITDRKRAEIALEEERHLSAEAERLAELGAWSWQLDTNQWRFSKGWSRIHGCDAQTMTTDELMTLAHPDDVRAIEDAFRVVIGGGSYAIEHRIVRPRTGMIRWVVASGELHRDAQGRRTVYGAVRDITDRKRMDEALRLARFTIDHVTAQVFWIRSDGSIIDVNDAALSALGYTRPQLLTLRVFDIDIDRSADSWSEHWEELGREKTTTFSSRQRRSDGSVAEVEVTLHLLNFDGQQIGCAFVRDVTERNRAEAMLRESDERYRLAILATNDAVWDIDLVTGTVHWSDRYTANFGRPMETANSWQWWIDRIHPDDRERTVGSLRTAIDGATRRWECEYRFLRIDGVWAQIHDRGYIARDKTGRARRMVGAMQDVTAHRQATAERDRLWNNGLDPCSVVDFDGRIKQVNPACVRALGWSAEEISGRPWVDFIHPDDLERTVQATEGLLVGETIKGFQNRLRHKDGVYRWFSWSAFPLLDMRLSIGIARDITEEKKRDEALRESEQRLRLALQAIASVGFVWDATKDSVIRYHSVEPALPMTLDGTERIAEVLAKVHPDDRARFEAKVTECIASGREYRHAFRVVRPDSTVRWLEELAILERDADGTLKRVTGLAIDVTERRLAEAELRHATDLLRAVVEGTTDAIYVKDRDGKYLLFNHAAAQFVGRSVAEVLGKDDAAIFDAESARWVMEHDRQIMAGGVPETSEETLTAAGVTRTYQSTKAPYRNSAGEVVGLIGISRDITEHKQVEQSLRSELAFRDALIRTASEGACVCFPTPDFPYVQFSLWNDQMTALTGYTMEEINRLGWYQTLYPDSEMRARAIDRMNRMREGDHLRAELWRITRKNGRERTISISTSIVKTTMGEPAVVALMTDVTDRGRTD